MVNSRERVRSTLAHVKPDRPPIDGSFRKEVWDDLHTHFSTTDDDAIMDRLGLDFRRAVLEPAQTFAAIAVPAPVSVGVGAGSRNLVRLWPDGIFEDDRGIRRVLDSTGTYFNYVFHPLAGAASPDGYAFPDPEATERYDNVRRQVHDYGDSYMIQIETGNIFRDAWELRGFEQFLEDMYLEPSFCSRLLDLVTEHKIAEVRHMVEEGADIIQMAGDIATEQSMMISPVWWRKEIKQRLARVIAATRRPGVYYYFHSDGEMTTIVPDLIEIGFDIIDPVQPECMDVLDVKRRFGDRVTLHSTLSAQQTLPFGSPADVRAEVRSRIRDCGYNGGLILAPSNVVQHDVPIANLLALYDEIAQAV